MNDNEHEVHRRVTRPSPWRSASFLLNGVLASAQSTGARACQYRRLLCHDHRTRRHDRARGAPAVFRAHHIAEIWPGTCKRAARLSQPSRTRPSRASSPSRRASADIYDAMFRHVVTPEHFIAVRIFPAGPRPTPWRTAWRSTPRAKRNRTARGEGRARGAGQSNSSQRNRPPDPAATKTGKT